MFEDLRPKIRRIENLDPVSAEQLQIQRSQTPGVPEDYLTFLAEIGFGEIKGQMFYDGLVEGDEIYPHLPQLSRFLIFADDQSGYCDAFDPNAKWRVVTLSPDGEADPCADTFSIYIRALFDQ